MIKYILAICSIGFAQQTYNSTAYNTVFQTPPGWVMGIPDTSFGVISLQVTRVGLQPVTMRLSRLLSNEAGNLAPGDETFFRLYKVFTVVNSTQAPVLNSIVDTIIGTLHYTGIITKQIDQNLVMVEWAVSNQSYLHTFIYSTTLSDFNTNSQLYLDPWNAFLFISLNGPAAKISSVGVKNQSLQNSELFDLLGRKKGIEMKYIKDNSSPLIINQK